MVPLFRGSTATVRRTVLHIHLPPYRSSYLIMYISNLLTVVIGDSSGHVGVCRLLQHANNQEYGPKVIEQLGRATGGCHWQIPALTIYIFKADPYCPTWVFDGFWPILLQISLLIRILAWDQNEQGGGTSIPSSLPTFMVL